MGAIRQALDTLYEQDFHAWALQQADALQRHDWRALDIANLVEEVESMGKQQRAEWVNRLVQLLAHLAKWQAQPDARAGHGRSWQLTIKEQRLQVAKHMKQNPSLKPFVPEALDDAWDVARVIAARESGLPLETFAHSCPFDSEEALRDDWLPA